MNRINYSSSGGDFSFLSRQDEVNLHLQVDVSHVSMIAEIFDAISYLKGACVIRMLENFLGAESFQVQSISLIRMCLCDANIYYKVNISSHTSVIMLCLYI
ncbi:hypothetical protein Droror1_Dr00009519 [Drosera rotundifolia]